MRYTGSKSAWEPLGIPVESPLEATTHRAVWWPGFVAKSRAAGDAKITTKDRGSSTAFPGTHTYI